MKRHGTAVGILLASAAMPGMAAAQTHTEDPAQPSGDSAITDIVVTAQKDSRTLQRTAAAITAISSDELVAKGVSDLTAAQTFVPSARIQTQASSVDIYLRGIGSTNDYANTEPPSALTFNGIYIPREGGSTPLFDIDRIEVLPGPQGTLYGRSAIGGVVNVAFTRPTRYLETKAIVEGGNYGLFHTTLVQNLPVSDSLAVRAGVDYMSHDGYLKSGAASADDIAGRLSLLYTPSDNFTAYIWGFATRKRGNSANLINKGFDPDTGTVDGSSFLNDDPWDDTVPEDFFPGAAVTANPRHYNNFAVGAQFDLQLGDITISDIPAYVEADMEQTYFLSALEGTYNAKIKSYSNELRISGDTGPVKWLAGLNLYRQVNSDESGLLPLFFNINQRNVSKGLGVFAQATYSVSDLLRLTLGGRYSTDTRTGRGLTTQVPTVLADVPWTADVSSNRFDWKVGVEYDAAPDVMLYATVQTGYQPATYNATPSTPTFDNKVDDSTITAYTAGFKSRFFDNTFQLNSEFFYYDYKNLPLQGTDLSLLFNPMFNADSVEIYGNQSDILFQPTRDDRLTIAVGYLHSRQTDAVAPVHPAFGNFSGVDVSGLQMQNAPTWTVAAGYSHDFQLDSGYIRASADTRYESKFYGIFTHAAGSLQKEHFMSNASITYHDDGGRWSFGVWIKNIEDEAVQATIGLLPPPLGPAAAFLQPPRTYGARLTLDF